MSVCLFIHFALIGWWGKILCCQTLFVVKPPTKYGWGGAWAGTGATTSHHQGLNTVSTSSCDRV